MYCILKYVLDAYNYYLQLAEQKEQAKRRMRFTMYNTKNRAGEGVAKTGVQEEEQTSIKPPSQVYFEELVGLTGTSHVEVNEIEREKVVNVDETEENISSVVAASVLPETISTSMSGQHVSLAQSASEVNVILNKQTSKSQEQRQPSKIKALLQRTTITTTTTKTITTTRTSEATSTSIKMAQNANLPTSTISYVDSVIVENRRKRNWHGHAVQSHSPLKLRNFPMVSGPLPEREYTEEELVELSYVPWDVEHFRSITSSKYGLDHCQENISGVENSQENSLDDSLNEILSSVDVLRQDPTVDISELSPTVFSFGPQTTSGLLTGSKQQDTFSEHSVSIDFMRQMLPGGVANDDFNLDPPSLNLGVSGVSGSGAENATTAGDSGLAVATPSTITPATAERQQKWPTTGMLATITEENFQREIRRRQTKQNLDTTSTPFVGVAEKSLTAPAENLGVGVTPDSALVVSDHNVEQEASNLTLAEKMPLSREEVEENKFFKNWSDVLRAREIEINYQNCDAHEKPRRVRRQQNRRRSDTPVVNHNQLAGLVAANHPLSGLLLPDFAPEAQTTPTKKRPSRDLDEPIREIVLAKKRSLSFLTPIEGNDESVLAKSSSPSFVAPITDHKDSVEPLETRSVDATRDLPPAALSATYDSFVGNNIEMISFITEHLPTWRSMMSQFDLPLKPCYTYDPHILMNADKNRLRVKMVVLNEIIRKRSIDLRTIPEINTSLDVAIAFRFCLDLAGADIVNLSADGCTVALKLFES